MNATHIVCRPLSAGGGTLPIGAEVDASAWRTVDRLVRQRYLKPKTEKDAPASTPALPIRRRGREVRNAN